MNFGGGGGAESLHYYALKQFFFLTRKKGWGGGDGLQKHVMCIECENKSIPSRHINVV